MLRKTGFVGEIIALILLAGFIGALGLFKTVKKVPWWKRWFGWLIPGDKR